MIPLLLESRAFFIFLAVTLVGVAERNGWLSETDRSSNVELVAEVMSWLATIITGAIAMYIQKHKKPTEEATIEVTAPKKFSLQILLNKIKEIRTKLIETPQQ